MFMLEFFNLLTTQSLCRQLKQELQVLQKMLSPLCLSFFYILLKYYNYSFILVEYYYIFTGIDLRGLVSGATIMMP